MWPSPYDNAIILVYGKVRFIWKFGQHHLE